MHGNMTAEVMKMEASSETCCLCGVVSDDLASLDEHDSALQLQDTPLRTQFIALSQNKSLPSGVVCGGCVSRASAAYDFQQTLRSARPAPALSDKIRALRHRLHELTQKIDVFIVVGEAGGTAEAPQYSEEDIILVDRAALAAAAATDARAPPSPAATARGDHAYQCSVCPRSFRRAADCAAHLATHSPAAAHCCWTCGGRYTTRAALAAHVCGAGAGAGAVGAGGQWRCPAPECGAVYTTRAALVQHATTTHTRGAARPVCAVCWATPQDAAAYTAHMLRHRRARRYVCGYDGCALRYPARPELVAHVRAVHGSAALTLSAPNTTQPTCERCGRTFGSVAAMKRHAHVHGPLASQVEEEAEAGAATEGEGEEESMVLGEEVGALEVEYLEVEELEEGGTLLSDIKPDLNLLTQL